jgi:hypothetical protein
MKKAKTKKIKKTTQRQVKHAAVKRPSRKATKKYPAYVLGIALVLVVLAETSVLYNATGTDWKKGLAVLDVSAGVTEVASAVNFSAQPFVVATTASTQFYKQSALATIQLLDPKDSDSMMFVEGVNDFYSMAATQMAGVLDISNYFSPMQTPLVAGATTYQYSY